MSEHKKDLRSPEPLLKNWRFYASLFLVILGISACNSTSTTPNAVEPLTNTPTFEPTITITKTLTPTLTPTAISATPTEQSTRAVTKTKIPQPRTATPTNQWPRLDWQKMTDAEVDLRCPCNDIYYNSDYKETARVILIPSGGLGYDSARIPVGYRMIYDADFAPNSSSRSAEMNLFAPDQYNLIPNPYGASYEKKVDVTPVAKIRTTLEKILGWDDHILHFEGGRGYPQGANAHWIMEWQNLDPNHPARVIARSQLIPK